VNCNPTYSVCNSATSLPGGGCRYRKPHPHQSKTKEEKEKKINKKNEDEIVQAGPGLVAVINEVTIDTQAPAPRLPRRLLR
jgi:hypothetical protein